MNEAVAACKKEFLLEIYNKLNWSEAVAIVTAYNFKDGR